MMSIIIVVWKPAEFKAKHKRHACMFQSFAHTHPTLALTCSTSSGRSWTVLTTGFLLGTEKRLFCVTQHKESAFLPCWQASVRDLWELVKASVRDLWELVSLSQRSMGIGQSQSEIYENWSKSQSEIYGNWSKPQSEIYRNWSKQKTENCMSGKSECRSRRVRGREGRVGGSAWIN